LAADEVVAEGSEERPRAPAEGEAARVTLSVAVASPMMAGEVLWPQTKVAVEAERGALTPNDDASFWVKSIGMTLASAVLIAPLGLVGLFVPALLDWPVWTLVVGLFATGLPVFAGIRVLHERADARLAAKVHELAARRRAQREVARTIPALGAGGDSVAVPGIVDDRVRDARS
jgi:hypothetical protein